MSTDPDRPGSPVTRAGRVIALLREHPRHLVLGTFVLAFAVGPRWPPGTVLLGGLGALASACPPRGAPTVALLVLVAAFGGAVAGQRRLMVADRFPAAGWFGHVLRAPAELTGPVQRDAWGGWHAPALLGGRWEGARVLLRAPATTRPPAAGEGALLDVRGALRALRPREGYLRPRGIGGVLDADAIADHGAVRGGVAGLVDGVRRRSRAALQRGVPVATGALLTGMVLGDPSGLPDDDAGALRTAGLTHLVAASGANVALLVAFVLAVGAVAGVPQRPRLALALAAIAVYVPLAGAGPSIQRAGVMGAASVVAVLAGRPAARWYAVLLAAAITLVVAPRAVEDPGWQLSFAAVGAILLGGRPLSASLRRRGWPGPVAEATAVTATATVATAPLLALHFGTLSLVSLPANLVAAVAVAPAMWAGFAAAVVGQVSGSAAAPLTLLAAVPAGFVLTVGRAAAAVPDAVVSAGWVPVAVGAAMAAGGVGTLLRRPRGNQTAAAPRGAPGSSRRGLCAVALVLVLAALLAHRLAASGGVARAPDAFQVAFLDVGQGDATLLRHGRSAILVDAGPPDGPVLRRLGELGVRRLDAVVLTHAEADHDGAVAGVLDALPVAVLLDGRDGVRDAYGARAAAAAARRGTRRVVATAGVVLRAGPMVLRVLSPPARDRALPADGNPNDRAVVATVTDGGLTALLPADSESPVVDGLAPEPVAILKVSHHGSADPGLPDLLERLRPRVAVMEVGAHNTYGHPTASTVAALARSVPAVARTDRDGTVLVTAHGGRLEVRRHAP